MKEKGYKLIRKLPYFNLSAVHCGLEILTSSPVDKAFARLLTLSPRFHSTHVHIFFLPLQELFGILSIYPFRLIICQKRKLARFRNLTIQFHFLLRLFTFASLCTRYGVCLCSNVYIYLCVCVSLCVVSNFACVWVV